MSVSAARNLVAGNPNYTFDGFVKDRQTGALAIASTDANGNPANGNTYSSVVISADDSRIVFTSNATNLVAGDTNGCQDIFVRTLQSPVSLTHDAGVSNTDKITSNPALTVVGTEAGQTLQYSVDGTPWSATYTPGGDEVNKTVQVRQVDAAGNVSTVVTFTFTLDTTPPTAPPEHLRTDQRQRRLQYGPDHQRPATDAHRPGDGSHGGLSLLV